MEIQITILVVPTVFFIILESWSGFCHHKNICMFSHDEQKPSSTKILDNLPSALNQKFGKGVPKNAIPLPK